MVDNALPAEGSEPATRTSTVSVVIPVLDDAELLQRCLAALARQSEAPFEVIVVDNGSTDDTRGVAERAGAVYVLERRRGIPAATAAGFDAASGDILARLDADSVPPPHWLARAREVLDSRRELVGVTGPGRFSSLPRPLRSIADRLYMRPYFAVFGRILGRPPLFGSSFALRQHAWQSARERVHRHDPEVHDDLDLSFALEEGSEVVVDPGLALTVSARPFAHPVAFARRISRALRTVRLHRRRTIDDRSLAE